MPGDARSIPAPGGVHRLGAGEVARIGYGAMQLRRRASDPAAAVALLERAIERGVDHLDTAQFYGDGLVNRLIRQVLRPGRTVVVATKVGAEVAPQATIPIRLAQRPEQLRASVEDNLASLGMERIPVVYLRRADVGPGLTASGDQVVDIDDQMAAMVAMRDEGKIGAIGLSAVDLDRLDRARPAGIACVQNAYSLADRRYEDMLRLCLAHGIAWVPFFPLGGGTGGAAQASRKVIDLPQVVAVAARIGATPTQVGLAWLLRRAANTLLIPGTTSLEHLEENLGSASVRLDDVAMAELDALGTVPAATPRP